MRIHGHDTARWLDADRLIAYPRFVLAAFAVFGLVWLILGGGFAGPDGTPLGREFLSLWAGASLALAGNPAASYDPALHQALQASVATSAAGGYAGWFYVPILFLLVLPLAFLPLIGALITWLALTFGLYLLMARALGREPAVFWPLIAFPAVYVSLATGQTGFLVVAVLGGVLLLGDRRPLIAGLLAGTLVVKPFVAVPVLLAYLASGRWRALAAATFSAGVLAGLSAQLLGVETWQAFLAAAPKSGWALESSGPAWDRMHSVFAAVRMLGGGPDAAIALHSLVGVSAMVSALWIWRQPVGPEIRGGALVCALLLANPYLRDFDLLLLALPIGMLLVLGRREGFHAWEAPALVLAWWLPAISVAVVPFIAIPVAPVPIVLILALILRRVSETAIEHGIAEGRSPVGAEAKPS